MATIKNLIPGYLKWCETHRARSNMRNAERFLSILENQFQDRDLCSLTKAEIEEFLDKHFLHFSNSYYRGAVFTIKSFHTWALSHGVLEKPIFTRLHLPARSLKELNKRIPSRNEHAIILKYSGMQFRRIYQAIRHSGAMPGQLCNCQISDFDKISGTLKIQRIVRNRSSNPLSLREEKTGIIIVRPYLLKILKRSVGSRKMGPVFLSPRGKAWTTSRLSQAFRLIRDRHGLSKDFNLYHASYDLLSTHVKKGEPLRTQYNNLRDRCFSGRTYAETFLIHLRKYAKSALGSEPCSWLIELIESWEPGKEAELLETWKKKYICPASQTWICPWDEHEERRWSELFRLTMKRSQPVRVRQTLREQLISLEQHLNEMEGAKV